MSKTRKPKKIDSLVIPRRSAEDLRADLERRRSGAADRHTNQARANTRPGHGNRGRATRAALKEFA